MPVELEDPAAAAPAPPLALAHTLTATATATAISPSPSATSSALSLGRQLAHFRIERLLGAGGMGEVYLASDLALDRPVALKVVAQDTATAARRERLIREARAQARIQHPNVCHIYYIGESEGLLFFAMELVTGQTFSDRVAKGPVAPDQALELIRMAALGLREATRCGFTHRDVKPSNLMIDQHGDVKVMDFGLVAGSASAEDLGGSVEQTSMAGTPLYMAPEQARGEPIDFRADIYALGATLYHLVAGRPPFAGETFAELLSQHSSAELPAFARRDVAARTLAPINELCARMMAKEPAARHASYDDLLRELELLSTERSRPAGATARAASAAIDFLLLLPVLMLVSWLSRTLGGRSINDLVILSLSFAAYRWLTVSWLGRSLGQSVFELEVVSMADGRRPSRLQSLRRVVWQLGLLIFLIPLPLLFSDRDRWTGDLASAAVPLGYAFLVLCLYFASMRRSRRRTWWDRRSHTMVRYRPR